MRRWLLAPVVALGVVGFVLLLVGSRWLERETFGDNWRTVR